MLNPACFARERWPNDRMSSRPNHRELRKEVGSRLFESLITDH
jgi:hypothetical protein